MKVLCTVLRHREVHSLTLGVFIALFGIASIVPAVAAQSTTAPPTNLTLAGLRKIDSMR